MSNDYTELFIENGFPTLSYVQAVEAFKRADANSTFFHLCREHSIYQLWNKTYLDALAIEIKGKIGNDLVIEVCAGNGILSKELSKRGINIIATDNKSWQRVKHAADVRTMDAIEAVKMYKPKMVIASWIPCGADIDFELLKTDVQFVILIGETDGGCCGSEKVWDDYEKLNYALIYLDEVDKFNLCRTDYEEGDGHSRTALFEKTKGGSEYTLPSSLWGDS